MLKSITMLISDGLSVEQCTGICVFFIPPTKCTTLVRKKTLLEQCAWILLKTSLKVKGTVVLGKDLGEQSTSSYSYRCFKIPYFSTTLILILRVTGSLIASSMISLLKATFLILFSLRVVKPLSSI